MVIYKAYYGLLLLAYSGMRDSLIFHSAPHVGHVDHAMSLFILIQNQACCSTFSY